MRLGRRTAGLLGAGVTYAVLTACVPTTTDPAVTTAAPQPAAATPVCAADPTLTQRQRLRAASDLLSLGDPCKARAELVAYHEKSPPNKMTRTMLRSIDGDPQEMFGAQYYTYRAQPGESLSLIAKDHLGDPLLFYALARYNGIERPMALSAGQILRIPGTAKPAPRRAADASAPNANGAEQGLAAVIDGAPSDGPLNDEVVAADAFAGEPVSSGGLAEEIEEPVIRTPETALADIEAAWGAGETARALTAAEAALEQFPGDGEVAASTAVYFEKYAEQRLGAGDMERAALAAERALELTRSSGGAPADVERLSSLTTRIEATGHCNQAQTAEADGRLMDAYNAYTSCLRLDPSNDGAQARLNVVRAETADMHYQSGLDAFDAERFEVAVEAFDAALAIDPGHAKARLKRDETAGIIDFLDTLGPSARSN